MPTQLHDRTLVTVPAVSTRIQSSADRVCSQYSSDVITDPDTGDTIEVTITGVTTSSDKVYFVRSPSIAEAWLSFTGYAKYGATGESLTASLRATDKHGASATTTVKIAVATYATTSAGAPRFDGSVGLLHYTDVSSFDYFRVETVEDVTGPTLTGAVFIDHPDTTNFPTRSIVTLYYDEALDTGSVPAGGANSPFVVRHTGNAGAKFSLATTSVVANNAVTFEVLGKAPDYWLSYTPPATA